MEAEKYIKEIISTVYPDREVRIAGQHKDLIKWKKWYAGVTDFHKRKVIEENQKVDRVIMHSDFGRLIASEWAAQFLNEGLLLSLGEGNEQFDKLNAVLAKNHFKTRLNEFAEKYFALGIGATVIRPSKIVGDQETKRLVPKKNTKVKIDYVDATRVIPITIEDKEVTECAFVKMGTKKVTIQVHLKDEETEEYVIVEVDGVTNDDTSYQLDLKARRVWKTTSTEPLFQVWFPAGVDNKYLNNQLGKSVIDNCIPYIMIYDEALDKFHKEYKNGGKKRFISTDLEYINPETGKTEKVPLGEEDTYLPPAASGDPSKVNEYASNIRADGFIRGLEYNANMISKVSGLGDGRFGVDANGRPVQTATAAILKESGAYKNVKKNENIADEKIKQLLMAIKYVYNECVEPNAFTFELEDIKIEFDDNIIEDNGAKKDQDLKEVNAGLMTKAQYLAKWTELNEEDALKALQEAGALINDYLPALQAGAMTPKQFVDKVYGPTCENHDEIVAYITNKMAAPSAESFADESDMVKDKPKKEEADA